MCGSGHVNKQIKQNLTDYSQWDTEHTYKLLNIANHAHN